MRFYNHVWAMFSTSILFAMFLQQSEVSHQVDVLYINLQANFKANHAVSTSLALGLSTLLKRWASPHFSGATTLL